MQIEQIARVPARILVVLKRPVQAVVRHDCAIFLQAGENNLVGL